MASEVWIAVALIITMADLVVIVVCLAKFTDRALDRHDRGIRFSLMTLFVATTLVAFHVAMVALFFRPFL